MSEPPPVPPRPSPQPMRVETLEYETAHQYRRPGILTTIGIMSIVVGSLSILASGVGIIQAIAYRMLLPAMASAAAMTPVPVVTPAAGNAATGGGSPYALVPGPNDATDGQRSIIVDTLGASQPLSQPRREMLDALLIQSWRDMFPFSPSAASDAMVRNTLRESGQTPDPPNPPVDYFILASGRVEVSDNDAVFSPSRGETVRITREQLQQAQALASGAPQPALTYTMTFPTTMPTAAAGPFPNGPFVAYGLASGVNLVLGIYLLVIGILVFSRSRRVRRQHFIYVWLKLPAAAATAVASAIMTSTFTSILTGGTPVADVTTAIQLALSVGYPIALLFALRAQPVMD